MKKVFNRVLMVILALALNVPAFLFTIPVNAASLYESNTTYGDWKDGITAETRYGQEFRPATSHFMTGMYLWMNKYGNPTGQTSIKVRADDENGAILYSGSISNSGLSETAEEEYTSMAGSTLLVAESTYFIEIYSNDADLNVPLVYHSQSGSNPYTRGAGHLTTNSGATWTPQTWDIYFKEYGTEEIAPSVSTYNATDIGLTTATISGFVGSLGSYTTGNISMVYGTTGGYGNETSSITVTVPTLYESGVTGLTSNTTYHYAVKFVYAGGTAYGEDATFTTSSDLTEGTQINVTTLYPENVTMTTAVLNGALLSLGDFTEADVWFQMRKAGDNTWSTISHTETMNATGTFNVTVTSAWFGQTILQNTDYEYRAVGVGDLNGHAGTVIYSDLVLSFHTSDTWTPTPYTFSLYDATQITKNTAMISGQLSGVSNTTESTITIELLSSNDVLLESHPYQVTGSGPVGNYFTGLTPNTVYKYRARLMVMDTPGLSTTKTFMTLTESGATPTATPTPTGTAFPPPSIPIPASWDTTIGHYFIIILGMLAFTLIMVYCLGRQVGGAIGGLGDCVIFAAGFVGGWIDITVTIFVVLIAGYVVWKVALSPRGA